MSNDKAKKLEKLSDYTLAVSNSMVVVGFLGAALYFIRKAVFQFRYAKSVDDWWIDAPEERSVGYEPESKN